MTALLELGLALRRRRAEMGLSQARVAVLSGLSRQTVNQLEMGAVPDLGLNKAERLAELLGLSLRVETGLASPSRLPSRMSPLARAAATASVSYRSELPADELRRMLSTGEVPDRYAPHLHALLDDAPVSLLAALAGQLQEECGYAREQVWKRYRSLARRVKSLRGLWQ
ncbi:helix-turn-helix transcriptional regulator [Lysobacter yananisis]|uniref:Helix-turn-helix transcriptional regulator n=1 Tax=Lysobacter yananisis TaxID=1003114 RepID=A0ABY9PGG2_9GAMM|nr:MULTISPECIES: helix-turn-helix transcriptional regulator [Lysobacter]QCW27740.1 helix-turn-helix transcriptional regulator [Lysobacter enzymogenes]WMT05469.1 helix-turn-helix transcriptional regulator [Lysobacter yananisis]